MERVDNTACSLDTACLNHVHGWTIWEWLRYLASQTPLSRSIGSLASLSATGRWILVTSGSLNHISRAQRAAWFQAFNPVVMHSPVFDLFQRSGSVSSSCIRPPSERTTGHTQSALHSALQCGVTDSAALAYCCSAASAKCRACFFSATHAGDNRDQFQRSPEGITQIHAPVRARYDRIVAAGQSAAHDANA